MAHIHTEPGQYDFTASAFIILEAKDMPPRMWFHQHKLIKKWLQFGGHVELHETPTQTLKHEIKEESGYGLDQLQILQPSRKALPNTDAVVHPRPVEVISLAFPGREGHFHTDLVYAFVAQELPAHRVGEGESDNLVAMTAAEIKKLPKDAIPENVRLAAIEILEEILPSWERISCRAFEF